jgi:hypothetical protein
MGPLLVHVVRCLPFNYYKMVTRKIKKFRHRACKVMIFMGVTGENMCDIMCSPFVSWCSLESMTYGKSAVVYSWLEAVFLLTKTRAGKVHSGAGRTLPMGWDGPRSAC